MPTESGLQKETRLQSDVAFLGNAEVTLALQSIRRFVDANV
jgi:hypothetical protein